MRIWRILIAWLMPAVIPLDTALPRAEAGQHVVLLHGLCRTPKSMERMEKALTQAGYRVHNVGYPTRKKTVEALARDHLDPLMASPELQAATQVHFVTHSLGSVVLRHYLKDGAPPHLGRIVFLGPPSRGSQVVDKIGHWKLFRALNGPAGQQLRTDPASLPNQLGPLGHEHAVIAGSCSINWINSCMIPGPDDGKVSVADTRLPDTSKHLVLPVTHPYLMKNTRVIRNVVHYLVDGRFEDEVSL